MSDPMAWHRGGGDTGTKIPWGSSLGTTSLPVPGFVLLLLCISQSQVGVFVWLVTGRTQ